MVKPILQSAIGVRTLYLGSPARRACLAERRRQPEDTPRATAGGVSATAPGRAGGQSHLRQNRGHQDLGLPPAPGGRRNPQQRLCLYNPHQQCSDAVRVPHQHFNQPCSDCSLQHCCYPGRSASWSWSPLCSRASCAVPDLGSVSAAAVWADVCPGGAAAPCCAAARAPAGGRASAGGGAQRDRAGLGGAVGASAGPGVRAGACAAAVAAGGGGAPRSSGALVRRVWWCAAVPVARAVGAPDPPAIAVSGGSRARPLGVAGVANRPGGGLRGSAAGAGGSGLRWGARCAPLAEPRGRGGAPPGFPPDGAPVLVRSAGGAAAGGAPAALRDRGGAVAGLVRAGVGGAGGGRGLPRVAAGGAGVGGGCAGVPGGGPLGGGPGGVPGAVAGSTRSSRGCAGSPRGGGWRG